MNTKEKIAVMQAALDGEEIEIFWEMKSKKWTLSKNPKELTWDWSECTYRVKPKKGFDVWWNNGNPSTKTVHFTSMSGVSESLARSAWNAAQEEMKSEWRQKD